MRRAKTFVGCMAASACAWVLTVGGSGSEVRAAAIRAREPQPPSTIQLQAVRFRGVPAPDAFGTVRDLESGDEVELELVIQRTIYANAAPLNPPVRDVALTSSNPQVFPVPSVVRVLANDMDSPYVLPMVVRPVTEPTPVEITAVMDGITRKVKFKVVPSPPNARRSPPGWDNPGDVWRPGGR